MELKDLLSKMAEYDEMEQPDGMNIAEEVKTFDDQKRVRSQITGLDIAVQAFADAISLNNGVNSKTYSTKELDAEKIKAIQEEIYDILVETFRNFDQRIENIIKENKLIEE